MLPLAIQCGMPLDLFWYGEEEYFNVFVKTYYENLKLQSWMNGQLSYVAYSVVMAKVFGKKAEYPSYEELTNKQEAKESYTEQDARDIISSCY